MGAAGVESLGTSKALSRPPTRASCPPPRATIAPPGGRSQGPPGGRCPVAVLRRSGAPSTTLPAWRKAERGRSPNAGGRQTRANARSEGWADDFRDGVAGSVTPPRAGASAPAPPRATRSRAPAARARPAGSRPPCAPPQAAAGRRSADTGKRPGRSDCVIDVGLLGLRVKGSVNWLVGAVSLPPADELHGFCTAPGALGGLELTDFSSGRCPRSRSALK